MQKSTIHFINNCIKHLPLDGPVYEFGSLQVHEDDNNNVDMRYNFQRNNLEYVGCDMREGPGVDQVQNLHALDIETDSVGCVVCMDTLEHVEYPRRAMKEIHRVLKPNGIAIISSVFEFPIHGYPNDYWRFTPNGLRSLLENFNACEVYSYGRSELNPQTVAGVGFKGRIPDITDFDAHSKKWEAWHTGIIMNLHQSP